MSTCRVGSDADLQNVQLHRIAFSNESNDFHFSEFRRQSPHHHRAVVAVVVIVDIMIVIGNCLRTILLLFVGACVCVCGEMRLAPFFSHIHTRAHKTVSRLLQTITTYLMCFSTIYCFCVISQASELTSGAMLFCIQIKFHKSRDSKHISLPPRTCSKPKQPNARLPLCVR